MSAAKLVRPSADYRDSFLDALVEYHQDGMLKELEYKRVAGDFDAFIADLCDDLGSHHRNHEAWSEKVRETVLWMVKEDEFIGFVKIRHRINWHLERFGGHVSFSIRPTMRGRGFGKKLLQRALPTIHAIGIEKALITIAPTNLPARRIVEFCGGVFEDETPMTEKFPAQLRFWINYD